VDALSIGSGASVTISPTTGTSNTVPEPSISILLGMGALGLLAYTWQRAAHHANDNQSEPKGHSSQWPFS
jgi:hypothetical protein